MDITDLQAHALSGAIHTRQVSCREVMQATLARIGAVNPIHNAIVSLRDGDAWCSACRPQAVSSSARPTPPSLGWARTPLTRCSA